MGDFSVLKGLVYKFNILSFFVSFPVLILIFSAIYISGPRILGGSHYILSFFLMGTFLYVLLKNNLSLMRVFGGVVVSQFIEVVARPSFLLLSLICVFFITGSYGLEEFSISYLLGFFLSLMVSLLVVRRISPKEYLMAGKGVSSVSWFSSGSALTLSSSVSVLKTSSDILMLGYMVSAAELGSYKVAAQGAALVAFAGQAVSSVVLPEFARLIHLSDKDGLRRVYRYSVILGLIPALFLMLAYLFSGKSIISGLFGDEYVNAYSSLLILSLGYLINSALGPVGMILDMSGLERFRVRIALTSSLLNISLNFILIPILGFVGAALATTASITLHDILVFLAVKKKANLIFWSEKWRG